MSIGPMGFFSSIAATPMAESQGSDVDLGSAGGFGPGPRNFAEHRRPKTRLASVRPTAKNTKRRIATPTAVA